MLFLSFYAKQLLQRLHLPNNIPRKLQEDGQAGMSISLDLIRFLWEIPRVGRVLRTAESHTKCNTNTDGFFFHVFLPLLLPPMWAFRVLYVYRLLCKWELFGLSILWHWRSSLRSAIRIPIPMSPQAAGNKWIACFLPQTWKMFHWQAYPRCRNCVCLFHSEEKMFRGTGTRQFGPLLGMRSVTCIPHDAIRGILSKCGVPIEAPHQERIPHSMIYAWEHQSLESLISLLVLPGEVAVWGGLLCFVRVKCHFTSEWTGEGGIWERRTDFISHGICEKVGMIQHRDSFNCTSSLRHFSHVSDVQCALFPMVSFFLWTLSFLPNNMY